MKSILTALMISAALLAGGCSDRETVTETAAGADPVIATEAARELTPEELGRLGATIEKDPANAERLLSQRGLDERSFETAIRRVSEDPEASKRYAEAYNREKA